MTRKRALPASRPPFARMMKIHEELHRGNLTNCSKLAKKLEVSTKTIMRDLAFMADQLNFPLEYDPQIYAWRYTSPVKDFPLISVNEGELFALLVAQKSLEQYKGTPYHDQLARAFNKLSAGLHEQVSFSAAGGLSNVSFHHSGYDKGDMRGFEKLSRAIIQRREVEFLYQKPKSKTAEKRRVQPYHLANRQNSWYLVGLDPDKNLLRHFSVGRMTAVTETKRQFEKPADFSPEKHYEKSFGAFVGVGNHKVVIHFSPAVADQVKERFWHESQEIKELADGPLVFSVLLDSLDEIKRWVLGWGPDAEVISPPELRKQVRQAAEATRKLY